MFSLRMYAREGESTPWYMGYAYRDFIIDEVVCYVFPINWIVRAWIEYRFRRHAKFPIRYEKEMHKAYLAGLRGRKWPPEL